MAAHARRSGVENDPKPACRGADAYSHRLRRLAVQDLTPEVVQELTDPEGW
jgi:hypothetical protein